MNLDRDAGSSVVLRRADLDHLAVVCVDDVCQRVQNRPGKFVQVGPLVRPHPAFLWSGFRLRKAEVEVDSNRSFPRFVWCKALCHVRHKASPGGKSLRGRCDHRFAVHEPRAGGALRDRQAVHLEGDRTFRPDAARRRQLPSALSLRSTDYWLWLPRCHVPILTSPSREASDVKPTKPRMVLTFVEDRMVSMGPGGYITRAGVGESGRVYFSVAF